MKRFLLIGPSDSSDGPPKNTSAPAEVCELTAKTTNAVRSTLAARTELDNQWICTSSQDCKHLRWRKNAFTNKKWIAQLPGIRARTFNVFSLVRTLVAIDVKVGAESAPRTSDVGRIGRLESPCDPARSPDIRQDSVTTRRVIRAATHESLEDGSSGGPAFTPKSAFLSHAHLWEALFVRRRHDRRRRREAFDQDRDCDQARN